MSQQYAIIVLQAPMMSFGDVAVDELRPTDRFPARSMMTGLFANALGWRWQDHEALAALQDRIRCAHREEDLGSAPGGRVLNDLQTAHVSLDDVAWTTRGQPETRAGDAATYRGPVMRQRMYLQDTRVVCAVRLTSPDASPTLDDITEALNRPARALYIGRRSCMPETRLFGGLRTAENGVAALQAVPSTGARASLRWDPEEGDPSVPPERERWIHDTRDWANGVHTGRRRVLEARAPRGGE